MNDLPRRRQRGSSPMSESGAELEEPLYSSFSSSAFSFLFIRSSSSGEGRKAGSYSSAGESRQTGPGDGVSP